MRYLGQMIILGAVAMVPLQAMAADAKTPAATAAAKPGATGDQPAGYDAYWDKMTAKSNGYITRDDWLDKSKKKFEEIDANGDGKISKDEMEAYRGKMRARYQALDTLRAQKKLDAPK